MALADVDAISYSWLGHPKDEYLSANLTLKKTVSLMQAKEHLSME